MFAGGGPDDSGGTGATWLFERGPGGEWRQLGDKLVGTGGIGESRQGASVAVSADGATLAVGGPGDDALIGATWIFKREVGGAWVQQGNKLVGTGGSYDFAGMGASVALSAEGTTLATVAGGPYDFAVYEQRIGATWVFTRSSAGEWAQVGSPLTWKITESSSEQGTAVAMSADGGVLATAQASTLDDYGAALVFTRVGDYWQDE